MLPLRTSSTRFYNRPMREVLTARGSGPGGGVAPAEFARSVVPSLPIAFAEEMLGEEEARGELVRDLDPTGNVRYFPNLYFR